VGIGSVAYLRAATTSICSTSTSTISATRDRIPGASYDVTAYIVTHKGSWLTRAIRKACAAEIVVGNSVGLIPELFPQLGCRRRRDRRARSPRSRSCVPSSAARHSATSGIALLDDAAFVKTRKRKATRIDDLPMIDWDLFDHASTSRSPTTRARRGRSSATDRRA
jgi:hypothetical protein